MKLLYLVLSCVDSATRYAISDEINSWNVARE